MPRTRCPHCQTIQTFEDADRGTLQICSECEGKYRAPAASKGAAAPSAPPPKAPAPRAAVKRQPADEEDVTHLEEVLDSPPDEDGADEEPEELEVVKRGRRKKRRGAIRAENFERVNKGLGFYYASILTLLGGFLAILAGVVGPLVLDERLAFVLILLGTLMIDWGAPILGLIGSILCLWAPTDSGARGLAIASMVLNVLAMLSGLVRLGLSFVPSLAMIGAYGVIPAFLATFVAWCLFMAFLRQLSTHLGEAELAAEAGAVLIRGIIILVLTPILLVTGLMLVAVLKCAGAIAFLVGVLFSLYGLFLFLRRQLDLIGSVRQVLESRY